jgi:hypothetical protein
MTPEDVFEAAIVAVKVILFSTAILLAGLTLPIWIIPYLVYQRLRAG